MKKILIVLFICFQNIIFCQETEFEAPNYEKIKKNIEDKSSNFYYKNLINRLEQKDTLLNKEDFRHLYFGFVFNKKYDAFWDTAQNKELESFFRSPKIDPKDYDKIISLLNKNLKEFPFDLKSLNFLSYLYKMKNEEIEDKKISFIIQNILETILKSGNGKTCETGFHVLLVSHEYAVLNLLNLERNSQSLVGKCDYLNFEKDKYKIKGLYFNIEKMLENESKMFGK